MRSWRVRVPSMATPDLLAVSVVLALPERQFVVRLSVPSGTTVAEAVARSALLEKLPGIDRAVQLSCAIYGRVVSPAHHVVQGDRIDVLRPLRMDPKERRRSQAAGRRGKR
jgi:uncharacterized protein